MNLAIIAPPNQPNWKRWTEQGTNYYLCLARVALKNPAYADFFFRKSKLDNALVIMDNGAAEEGTLTPDELNMAARICGATEIVVPDVVNDSVATAKLASQAEYLNGDLMVVPQGQTLTEWLLCLDEQLNQSRISAVGVSKYCPVPRHELLGELERRGYHNNSLKFHLLGLTDRPRSVGQWAAQFPWVRGMDTACPVAYGLAGVFLEDATEHIGLNWKAERGLYDEVVDHNIKVFKQWANIL